MPERNSNTSQSPINLSSFEGFSSLRSPAALIEIGENLLRSLDSLNITLRPLSQTVSPEELRKEIPHGRIVSCDFYMQGAEKSRPTLGGFEFDDHDILNIDHHAPHKSMFRRYSSGNLAADYVTSNGPVSADTHVVISHTDCDSIVSSLIVRGAIPPHPLFTSAVIAADHTGEVHPVSDLLQALDTKRSIASSVRDLGLILTGQKLSKSSQELVDRRAEGRMETAEAVFSGKGFERGRLAIIEITGNMRNEFLPALFPNAAVILTFESGRTHGSTIARFRLGNGAPDGFTLFDLNINSEIDPGFGGRWNAGANKRGGGTMLSREEYADRTLASLERALGRE